jgi:HEAT repeat protein
LLQEAENALNDRLAKIPVLVELRYLPSEANESSVCDRILAFMDKHDPALDIDEAGIKQLLRQGRLLLLVDGVNELPSDRGRVMVTQFRELYQKTCPMIFTTRELSAGGDLGIAKRLEMQPLTEPQMQQFVMAYLPTEGERLLRQLSGRLREFGQTPLLLWMLCSLFQKSEQIPPNLGMVFRAFTVGYGDRIKQDVTLSKDSRAWWGRLLQYLAFKMTCGENFTELQVAISRRGAEQFLVEFLRGKVEFEEACAMHWLEDLLKHHLIQISNDRIEFRHQLIQEYYAAEWVLGLLPSLSDARLRQGYLNYLKWTEPLALMLELVKSEEQAVRVVRLALEVDLRLGARLAGAVRYGFQEKTVGLLMQEIEERKIPQLYVIKFLGEIKSNFAVDILILALKDSSDKVRMSAAEALGKIGSDKAVDSLILALKDSDDYVRMNAVEALGKIGSDKAVDSLILALKDSDDYVRMNAAEVLGDIGSDKAVDSLIPVALKDSDDYVRMNAVEALGKIGSDKAVDSLILALKDSDDYVRMNAAEVLGDIGSDKAVDPLILALKYSNFGLHMNAAEALGKIGSDKAVDSLILALKYSGEIAAAALGDTGSDKAVDPLILTLKYSSNSYARYQAAKALGKIGSDKAVDPLILALKYSNDYVRMGAAAALGDIGSDKAVDPLILALKDSNFFGLIDRAAAALGKIGSDKAVDPLILTLKDSYTNERCTAAAALGKIGSNKAVDPLILALIDSNNFVRMRAAAALGDIGSGKAVDPLILALKDSSDKVRMSAAEALGKIAKADRNLPTLTQQLPHLLTLIPTEASEEALSVITAIQSRCKYYNYAIYDTHLQEAEDCANPVEKILQEIHQTLKTMSETGKYDIKAEVVQIVEKNYGQVIGKNSGQAIGKNYANDPALLQTINEITQVLANLQKAHPTATEAEAKDIIEAEFKEIQNNQPNRWTNFRQQLLNPERWLNGGKATISEIAKHYAENSVFLKAGVAFLDGFSADEE